MSNPGPFWTARQFDEPPAAFAERAVTEPGPVTRHLYPAQSARDAAVSGYGNPAYWAYLDRHAAELAGKFPARAEYFMTRSLSESLAGNDGD